MSVFFKWLSSSSSTNTSNADDISRKDVCYHIEGFLSCSYFHTATEAADRLSAKYPNVKVDVSAYTRQQWPERSQELRKEFDTQHRTSPFIYEGCSAGQHNVIGGYSDFAKILKSNYQMNVPMN